MKQADMAMRRGATKAAKKSRPGDMLGSNSEIGRKLKQYYDTLIADDIPDRFTELLDQLQKQEDTKSAAEKE